MDTPEIPARGLHLQVRLLCRNSALPPALPTVADHPLPRAVQHLPDRTFRRILLRRLFLVLLCGVSLPALAAGQDRGGTQSRRADSTGSEFGRYFALLISVQNYEDSAIPDLSNPIRDGFQLADVLRNEYAFDQVGFLENPNREEIFTRLTEYERELGPNDNLIIFYAGHGVYNGANEQGYWWPSDADRRVESSWISNSDIRDKFKLIDARHILLISDACFSGSVLDAEGVSRSVDIGVTDTVATRTYRNKSRRAITSGSLEPVPDESEFLKALVSVLQENTSQYLLAGSVWDAIRRQVQTEQVPQYGKIVGVDDLGGDFVFVRSDGDDAAGPAAFVARPYIRAVGLGLQGVRARVQSDSTISIEYSLLPTFKGNKKYNVRLLYAVGSIPPAPVTRASGDVGSRQRVGESKIINWALLEDVPDPNLQIRLWLEAERVPGFFERYRWPLVIAGVLGGAIAGDCLGPNMILCKTTGTDLSDIRTPGRPNGTSANR